MQIKTKSKKREEIIKGVLLFLAAYNSSLFEKLSNNIHVIEFSNTNKVQYIKKHRIIKIPVNFLKNTVPENIVYYLLKVLEDSGDISKNIAKKFIHATNSKRYIWDNVDIEIIKT